MLFNEPMILFLTFLKCLTCTGLVLWMKGRKVVIFLPDNYLFTLNAYSHCLVILLQLVSINMVFATLTLFQLCSLAPSLVHKTLPLMSVGDLE